MNSSKNQRLLLDIMLEGSRQRDSLPGKIGGLDNGCDTFTVYEYKILPPPWESNAHGGQEEAFDWPQLCTEQASKPLLSTQPCRYNARKQEDGQVTLSPSQRNSQPNAQLGTMLN